MKPGILRTPLGWKRRLTVGTLAKTFRRAHRPIHQGDRIVYDLPGNLMPRSSARRTGIHPV